MKYIDSLSHLAAPTRRYLSWMARTMLNEELINKSDTHLDYGCGKGSDVKILKDKGYQSMGYDPYYFPELIVKQADIVSCGYVLNVLSSRCDRLDIIRKCWKLTKSKLIIAAQTGKENKLSLVELRAMIEVVTKSRAIKLKKGIFLVEKMPLYEIEVLSKVEVIKECDRINNSGWVAPIGAFIKGYCTGFKGNKLRFNNHPSFGLFPAKRYYKMCHKESILPGKSGKLIANMHLGKDKECDRYNWAVEGILRRNRIMRLKFHCSDFCFLDEFSNCKNWDFLDPNWIPNPDPLGYTDQSKKPYKIRNINPSVPIIR